MWSGRGPDPARRTARRVAAGGLCLGAVCLLAAAAIYVAAASDTPPATWADVWRLATSLRLVLAAIASMGTILLSVGAVFALLDRTGLLASVTVPRNAAEEREPRHDPSRPESHGGDAAPAGGYPAQVPPLAPGHGAGPGGAGYTEPGAFPSRGATREDAPVSPTDRVPSLDMSGAALTGTGESSKTRATGRESDEAAGPDPEVRPPAPGAPPTEAETPQPEPGEPSPAQAPQPDDLVTAWDDYRRDGDGHFSRRGLQAVLDHRGLAAEVSAGDRIGAGGAVLIVETTSSAPNFYVLPSFNRSPRAVADWFDDDSGGALTGRTQRVTRVAQGRWVEAETDIGRGFEVLERGEIA